jgi:enamine deaminase RidA (YjgF/YER057c/UK114 family)
MSDVTITVAEAYGRRCASSGAPWEPIVGYSRAVRSGNLVCVSGTVGLDADGTYPPTAGAQARRALTIVRAAIEALGGRLEHVIRTRLYLVNMARDRDAVGRVHGEFFAEIRPASMMVEVSRFVDEAMLVEIEADAVVPD